MNQLTFTRCWIGTILLFIALAATTWLWEPYHYFPAYGMVGYTLIILLLLFTIGQAEKRWHYIVIGMTLVLAGIIASIDIILSRTEIVQGLQQLQYSWAREVFSHKETVTNLVNMLVILLNIFTSSLAADVLFHGLNRQNFIRS